MRTDFFPALLVLATVVLLSACNSQQVVTQTSTGDFGKTSPAARDSIRSFLEGYYDTMSARDWDAYRTYFWDEAILSTIWQKPGEDRARIFINTVDEFVAQSAEGPDSKPIFEEKMSGEPFIWIGENMATAHARYHAKFGTKEELLEWDGIDVFTLMRHGNQWKIISLAYE